MDHNYKTNLKNVDFFDSAITFQSSIGPPLVNIAATW